MEAGQLIDGLGGTTAVARLIGVRAPSVTNWRKTGIPEGRLIQLAPEAEKRGIASRQQLLSATTCQRIWPDLDKEQGAEPDSALPASTPLAGQDDGAASGQRGAGVG